MTSLQKTITTGMGIMQLYEEVTGRLLFTVNTFIQEALNQIPFEGSWTPAQVIVHITKSNLSITQVLSLKGKPANRLPDQQVDGLKNIFLNFDTKLKSPEFIIPEPGIYERKNLIGSLKNSISQLQQVQENADLTEEIKHPIFGNITKL